MREYRPRLVVGTYTDVLVQRLRRQIRAHATEHPGLLSFQKAWFRDRLEACGLVDQYFNASTGEGDEGETDYMGPWNKANGLHLVQSDVVDAKDERLNTKPYMPQLGTEVTSPADSTPVGENVGPVVRDKLPRKKAS